MIFYHALTKVTFKIIKGTGFGTGENDFKFTDSGKNIILKSFFTSGTFDIVSGEFKTNEPDRGIADIETMHITSDTHTAAVGSQAYELVCLLLPGTDLNDATANKINLTIDHNEYHMTKKQLMDALYWDDDSNPVTDKVIKKLSNGTTEALDANKMRPGVHYIFTLTVGKKMIDNITASVVEWEDVNAEETTPTNARITVSLLDNGTKKTGDADFDLFRFAEISSTINDDFEGYEWVKGYAPADNKAKLDENSSGTGIYTAKETTDPYKVWYWPDNKTFYHFRTVSPKTTPSWKVEEHQEGEPAVTTYDYITLTGAENYTDVCWGAPFYKINVTGSERLSYDVDERGFDGTSTSEHQISKAIGPTDGIINMVMFHMMSDITIKLKTTTGDDKVIIKGAHISISNVKPTGEVRMGNGLVTTTGTVGTVTGTVVDDPDETGDTDYSDQKWHYGFVPQSLDGGNNEVITDDIVLTITTTDNNQYIIDLKNLVNTTYSNKLIANPYTANGNKITRWYPNFKYVYTFKLKKTGIAEISATLADWETVTAGDDNVQIK